MNRYGTISIRSKCCTGVELITVTSSMYTRQIAKFKPLRVKFINLWKQLGALQTPNGKTLKRNIPRRVTKAVLSILPGLKAHWKYPISDLG